MSVNLNVKAKVIFFATKQLCWLMARKSCRYDEKLKFDQSAQVLGLKVSLNYFSVCPSGFDWFNQQGCVTVVTTASSKASAAQTCQGMNPLASLAMPKSDFTSMQMNQLVSSKNLTNGKFFIGMTKVGNQWIWDDGTPVFVRRKSLGS